MEKQKLLTDEQKKGKVKNKMAEVKHNELEAIIGERKVTSPFNDILVTDIVGMGAKEHDAYVNMVKDRAGDKEVLAIAALKDDEDHVTIHYVTESNNKFERIRRIN